MSEPVVIQAEWLPVQYEVRQVSSGTIALLIGSPFYRDIDPLQIEFELASV
ncbi:hypothetical protein OZ401_002745 [Candidatus Chlorohelix allophototropha]|uniref:Uncharacterized protein n=1 Tax=Candidatus Chlorohelix allophototropha TaxID=3003348 RepID=A0ABY9B7G6_9CHLR|nr:hypothetical protein OZ401_002745 [Chloroflexota bacterium L227-S17]